MVQKYCFRVVLLFILSIMLHLSALASTEENIDVITKFISKSAKIIGGDKNIGVKLSMNWDKNPEVDEIIAYGNVKRVATINAIISYLNENEKKIFPKITSSDSEIADLVMMLNGTIDYGNIYVNARKSREDKIAILLFKNKDFVMERLKLEMKDDNIANILANKTYLISLLQACSSVAQLCSKL